MNYLKQHQNRMAQKRTVKRTLGFIFFSLLLITGFNIFQIGVVKYGDFAKQVWNTQILVQNCNDLEDFKRDYPKSSFHKKEIEDCKLLGIIF